MADLKKCTKITVSFKQSKRDEELYEFIQALEDKNSDIKTVLYNLFILQNKELNNIIVENMIEEVSSKLNKFQKNIMADNNLVNQAEQQFNNTMNQKKVDTSSCMPQ